MSTRVFVLLKTVPNRLRTWAILLLAGGRPVALNLHLTRGLYLQHSGLGGLYLNIQVDGSKEPPGVPDGIGFYVGTPQAEKRRACKLLKLKE